ncbi:MAG: hypothetical protein ACI9J4_000291 [Paraglaciecola sp.]|jgi:hypothetical protein
MLIAGLSEFLIIAGILFALKQRDRRQSTALAYGYVLCAFTVALSALLGALQFLEIANVGSVYQALVYTSTFFAMTGFTVIGLWPTLFNTNKVYIAYGLLAFALMGFIINLFISLPILGNLALCIAVITSILLIPNTRRYSIGGLSILLSTVIFGLIITDNNIRIGVFHLCIGLFFVAMGLTFKHLDSNNK